MSEKLSISQWAEEDKPRENWSDWEHQHYPMPNC